MTRVDSRNGFAKNDNAINIVLIITIKLQSSTNTNLRRPQGMDRGVKKDLRTNNKVRSIGAHLFYGAKLY